MEVENGMRGQTEQGRRATTTNPYFVVSRLGSGGMGVVYEAVEAGSFRRVALKILRHGRTDPASARRALEREAVAMTMARGSRVCRTFGLGECYGQPCLVMERLVGCTLQTRLALGPMSVRTVIDIASQIATALQGIHRAGLVHSDIKPANVFITENGRIKILDFGLATTADERVSGAHADLEPLGTASYISPERILRAPIDHRSDLFSFGAVLYEMAFSRSPFAAATPAEALFNVLEREPPAVADLESTPASAVDRLARILMDKRPARRCQSAAEVRKALARIDVDRSRAARAVIHRPLHTRRTSHGFVNCQLH
jgi:eukaryotic-like serine/threonine-protein kinase